jgi:hypothetical protein
MLINVLTTAPGGSIVVSATAGSIGGTVACTGCDAIYAANTSTTLYVAVRAGVGAQTASLTTDVLIPPGGAVLLPANETTTGVAAYASGAGPAIVGFSPIKRGQSV